MGLNKRFENRSVIVTGGASGIGLATAKLFASEGALVAVVDLNLDRLVQAKIEIEKLESGQVETFQCDVSEAEAVRKTVEQIENRFKRLDVIVNNAGLMVFKPLEQHTTEDWNKVLGVDLLGTFNFIQQAFLKMKSGGAIINVSSIHA